MLSESKTIELKREYTDEIKKTVIAFANSDGGKIYIGINDDGGVCGVVDADDILQKVGNSIRDNIRPDITMFTEIYSDLVDGKAVVIVNVQRGTARPYYLAGKGIRPEGVFLRHGSSSVPASDAAILNMIKATSGDSYEDSRSINQQLTFNYAASYFEKKGVQFEDNHKKTLHMTGDDAMYTNLALLMSDQCMHTIKLAVFEGEKKHIFRERREFSGSILHQLEEAFSFIDRFNNTRAEFSGLDRIDTRDYPPEAIREALLNAVVHRDYSFNGSILISIFEDHIEFVTIGGLVKGLTLNDIMLGLSVPRNQYLANIFYRLKLIEAYGTGIPKIIGCYEDYHVKPQLIATDNAFKVILPNINSIFAATKKQTVSSYTDRENMIISLLNKQKSINRKDAESATGLSQASTITLLREMVDKGILRKTGSGNQVRYEKN